MYDEDGDAFRVDVYNLHRANAAGDGHLEDSAHGGTHMTDAEATGELPAVGGV